MLHDAQKRRHRQLPDQEDTDSELFARISTNVVQSYVTFFPSQAWYIGCNVTAASEQLLANLFPIKCELVVDMGYSCVTSQATTEDGYVIDIDRVALPQEARYMTRPENGTRRPPILLVPGITIDSGLWFVHYSPHSCELVVDMGYSCVTSQATTEDGYVIDIDRVALPQEARYMTRPENGYALADHEYDVWSMNTRDDACCSRHKNLSQDDNRYWRWSFDEIGRYDIAAAIDHVLNATGSTRIPVLVYSQTFLSAVILLSTRPEYNDKIDILLSYAPVTPPSTHRFPFAQLEAFVDALLAVERVEGMNVVERTRKLKALKVPVEIPPLVAREDRIAAAHQ
ncbi:hypothetical protein HPB50_001280 [Hyalomma asiaticum]|uniref:Uncharacterized protein n=1 Tax=Hyalomma asiaticum TaxID=266040 RepID=A0ACB7RNJ9_HYAAI|nr:hypothetical protein HPB50_001280 [Hyalomma asiaticum]